MENREQKIIEICHKCLEDVNDALCQAISYAISEGYKIGWFDGRESSEEYVKAVNEFKERCEEEKNNE